MDALRLCSRLSVSVLLSLQCDFPFSFLIRFVLSHHCCFSRALSLSHARTHPIRVEPFACARFACFANKLQLNSTIKNSKKNHTHTQSHSLNPLKHTYFPHSFYSPSPLFSSPTLFTALAMKNLPESFALSRALGKTPYPHTEHTAQHWLPIFTQFSSDANTRDLATHAHASIHTHTLAR